MNDDQDKEHAEQHQAMQEIEQLTVDALLASKTRPLTDDEIMAVAWSAGVTNTVYQELRK